MTTLRVSILILVFSIPSFAQERQDSETFKRVFGISRFLPKDLVDKVKALPAGQSLKLDTNGDGRIDELWYIDTSRRHTISPMLVRVVDGDGDMQDMGRGDLDSDTWIWDRGADGYIDAVTVYQDDDHDGDVDQMGMFHDKKWPDVKDCLTVWWAVDVGDDNLLWYEVNGDYDQPLCQWRTHFSGDEVFYQFRLTPDDPKWVSTWEDPFAFYDPDHDQCSEEVVRVSAKGDKIENLRFSIDADNDAYGTHTHDYDFGITALAPPDGLKADSAYTTTYKIRGIETQPVLSWDKTRQFAKNAPWAKVMLTWDEINSNTDEKPDQDPHERWEGILNHASKRGDFVQVGGPPSSAFNKRVEVTDKPVSPIGVYWDDYDARYHLVGAKYAYLDVDFDLDGKVDATYVWEDVDGDGFLDRCLIDVDADGTVDIEKPMWGKNKINDIAFESFRDFYPAQLNNHIDQTQLFIDAAQHLLKTTPQNVSDIVDFFAGPLATYHPETELGGRIRSTPAGARLYMDLVCNRLLVELRKHHNQYPNWENIEKRFFQGKYEDAARLLVEKMPPPSDHALHYDGETYTKRIAIKIDASSSLMPVLENVPYVLNVSRVQKSLSDFNPRHCVVVDGDYRLTWRVVPHQLDSFDFEGGEQISFLTNLERDRAKAYYVFYQPAGEKTPTFLQLTRAVLDNPAYVAWESDAGAYRFYTGQFDFFGKQEGRLLPRDKRLLYPLVGQNYHSEQEWGMDSLHVNKTSGLGGLTLYANNNKEYPVQSPAGVGNVEFEHHVLGAGPIRSAVEIIATDVLPEAPEKQVVLRCFSYAKHPESEVRVRLPKGLANPLLAPGLLKLNEDHPFADKSFGYLGTWGYQDPEIGEIGLAVIMSRKTATKIEELPDERRIVSTVYYNQENYSGPHLRYWIIGAWRRGMQYPVAPTVENWKSMTRDLALYLNTERNVTISYHVDAHE